MMAILYYMRRDNELFQKLRPLTRVSLFELRCRFEDGLRAQHSLSNCHALEAISLLALFRHDTYLFRRFSPNDHQLP